MTSNELSDIHDFIRTEHRRRRPSEISSNTFADREFMASDGCHGLSTREALVQLHKDMLQEVERMKDEFSKRDFMFWLKESISFKSELSKMRWPSVLFMTAQAVAHFIVAFILDVDNLATSWVGFQGFILTALLIFNLTVNLWDTKLRFKELLMKSEQILHLVKRCSGDKHLLKQWMRYSWNSARAKALFIPKSPCVHQTLTYRDESCLNLPDFLLVKGDIIHLYPGERAPGDCISLRTLGEGNMRGRGNEKDDKITLNEGQIFHETAASGDKDAECHMDSDNPRLMNKKRMALQFGHAKLRKAHKGTDFLMLSTPYINSLRISLQRSHKRPVNSVEKECFIVSRKYFETFVIPSVFVLSTIVTAIHYGYLDLTDSDQKIKTISIAYLLLRPSLTIMPFLPWMFPCFWLAVNAYGSARLLRCGEAQRARSSRRSNGPLPDDPNASPLKFGNLLATPTAADSSENKHDEDELLELRSNIKFLAIFKTCIDLIRGKSGHVWRSSNLLQVLGCLTSLCCIDKVGILSLSNPTPEKVFVLTKNEDEESQFLMPTRNDSDGNESLNHRVSDLDTDCPTTLLPDMHSEHEFGHLRDSQEHISVNPADQDGQAKHKRAYHPNLFRSEVLDVSHTTDCFRSDLSAASFAHPLKLQFDDLSWRKYFNNLKPLGLAIMMNNCCEKSFGDYFRFYKHISYKSILTCNLTPVVKRRCLCGLSDMIGFTREAISNYDYSSQIGIYKLINPSSIKKGKLASSLENATRLKLPFSNMTCNIHQDVTTGGHQVFSQGTADIVLDACVEFWDGHQLAPLDESIRKKVLDFYHRTSLTSYCVAFSYTPLLRSHNLGDRYIELPPENSKCVPHLRKLANEQQEEFLQSQLVTLPSNKMQASQLNGSGSTIFESEREPKSRTIDRTGRTKSHEGIHMTRRHLSFEWLSDATGPDRLDSNAVIDNHRTMCSGGRKLNDTLDELTDQVFVGMVAMQYQACTDFVTLVEQLEHACIRFVHFSKENELRSRVFSEKMGLESGWNCHISLQSDQDLDKADRSGASTLKQLSKPGAKSRPESLQPSSFSPNTRISSLLLGCHSDKSIDKLETDQDAKTSGQMATSGPRMGSISSDERTLYSWRSLPSLVMQLSAKLSVVRQHLSNATSNGERKSTTNNLNIEFGDQLSQTGQISEMAFGDDEVGQEQAAISCAGESSSVKDEGFETLAFDMSNRAKLPKGIENIRPHLETVDNVPLQVSLFTDCTPNLTKEMIEIMQDYGEIVCVIGSSSSRLNTPIFLQANASIAIEPLVPQCCTRDECDRQSPKRRARKARKKRRARRERRAKTAKTTTAKSSEGQEYTSIQMKPRQNNPRDRLGIGVSKPQVVTSTTVKVPASSSSSDSSANTSGSSSDSSESGSSSASVSPLSRSDISDSDSDFGDETTRAGSSGSTRDSAGSPTGAHSRLARELPTPNALASKLASLPCSYSYNRKDQVNLYSLIMEARHFTFKMKNTFVCMICFALSISSAQFLASLLFLPPMLSSGLTIWLTVVVVPMMSFSLMSTTMDSQVMKIAVGKNLQLKPENITFFVICYLIKFIPSIIVVVLSFGLIIAHSCKLTGFGSSSLGPCWMFTYVQHGNATSNETGDEDLLWSTHLLTAQVCAAFLLVLYFIVISSGFVHRSHLMWQMSPLRNKFWVIISLILMIGQLIYNQLFLQVNLGSSAIPYEFIASLPAHIWIISFTWPVLVVGANLLVKRAEIKATIRQQRRARFDFNTKLGMNSPF